MEPLIRFTTDGVTRESVKVFILGFIADEGVRMMFDRKDVSHIADAKDLIEKAFIQLEQDYGTPAPTRKQINQAE
jgi:hypothetical protein